MAKYTLVPHVTAEKLLPMLPKTLGGIVDPSVITEPEFTVALFPSETRKITTSRQLQQLLDHLEELQPLVIIGLRFTEEAAELARQSTPYFFCKDDSFWTDKSIHNARQGKS